MMAAPAAWAAPAPVTGLQLSTKDAVVYAGWSSSPGTPSAVVCWALNSAPATPTDADATCSGTVTAPTTYYSFGATAGGSYGVSVFAYDTASGEYSSPVGGTITAQDLPPVPVGVGTAAHGASAVIAQWVDRLNGDTKDYLVSWQRGLATPSVDGATVTTATRLTIGSLVPGAVYTIAVRVRDRGGNVSDPSVIQVATRVPGFRIADNARAGGGIETAARLASNIDIDGSAVVGSAGRLTASFLAIPADGSRSTLRLVTHTPTAGWLPGTYISSTNYPQHPLVATAGRFAVAAWSSLHGVAYSVRTAGRWSRVRHLPDATRAQGVLGVIVAPSGLLHFLVRAPHGLRYVTVNGSHVVSAGITGTSVVADTGRLARDPVTGNVAIEMHRATSSVETIRVTVLGANATKVGTMSTWLSVTRHGELPPNWPATGLATYGGRVFLAVQRNVARDPYGRNGPYLASGTATSHRPFVRVPETGPSDTDLTVSAPAKNRVVLSWQRHDTEWRTTRLGIWTARASFSSTHGHWSFTVARHWTRSAYDFPLGAFADSLGHLYVTYIQQPHDVSECQQCPGEAIRGANLW